MLGKYHGGVKIVPSGCGKSTTGVWKKYHGGMRTIYGTKTIGIMASLWHISFGLREAHGDEVS